MHSPFQPGDLVKIAITLFLAFICTESRSPIGLHAFFLDLSAFSAKMLPPFVCHVGISLIVVFERDLGSALLFFVFLSSCSIATGRASWLLLSVLRSGYWRRGAFTTSLVTFRFSSTFGLIRSKIPLRRLPNCPVPHSCRWRSCWHRN